MIAKLPFNKYVAFFFAAGLLFITSCKKVDAGNGTITNQRVETEDFDKIILHTGGHLNYKQDTYTQISVNTTQEVFEALNIFVEDKTLHIKRKKGYKIKNQDEMTFDIVDDDTYSIEVCGSGDIVADFDENYYFNEHYLIISGSGDIRADQVNGSKHISKISGSGNIDVDQVNVAEVTSKIYGSGNIEFANLSTSNSVTKITGSGNVYMLSGFSDLSEIDISGSGSIKAYPINTYTTDIVSSGSGMAYVRVENMLNADLTGSGSVYYKGYPSTAIAISGTGNVIDAN